MNLTNKTLYLLVSFSVDDCRQKFLIDTVNSINNEITTKNIDMTDDLIIFDNNSPRQDTATILSHFKNLYVAKKNYGLWSAINWAVNTFSEKYDYIHVIESDLIYYSLEKMAACERTLDLRQDVGCVWCMEFSIADRYRFSKNHPRPDSVKRSWTTQSANVIGQAVNFGKEINEGIFECSMNPQLVGLLRTKTVKRVFEEIGSHNIFTEFDFYKRYFKYHNINAILDGGLHYSPGNDPDKKITRGSTTFNDVYMETRKSYIHDLNEMEIEKR